MNCVDDCEYREMLDDANADLQELKAENAKLRDKYDSYEQKMDALVWTITGGLLSKSASTPNDVLYSTAEESLTKRLQSENTKLRELVRRYGEYTDQDRCEGCVCKSRCNEGDIEECWQLAEIRELARELGVEVNL